MFYLTNLETTNEEKLKKVFSFIYYLKKKNFIIENLCIIIYAKNNNVNN